MCCNPFLLLIILISNCVRFGPWSPFKPAPTNPSSLLSGTISCSKHGMEHLPGPSSLTDRRSSRSPLDPRAARGGKQAASEAEGPESAFGLCLRSTTSLALINGPTSRRQDTGLLGHLMSHLIHLLFAHRRILIMVQRWRKTGLLQLRGGKENIDGKSARACASPGSPGLCLSLLYLPFCLVEV